MARVSLGRVLAVFFVSAVMALAILYFFAMPVKLASAQVLLRASVLECTEPVGDVDPSILENGGQVVELDEAETAAYAVAASNATMFFSGVTSRAVVFPDGVVLHVIMHDGRYCWSGRLPVALHAQIMESLRGQAI